MTKAPTPVRPADETNSATSVGAARIARAFEQARRENRAALIPYLALGHPTPAASLELAKAAIAGGADLLELGVPFSDPARCLELARHLRRYENVVPLIFMGYYNPILAYGEEAFCRACSEAGVDGLIVPDLPPEEGERLESTCRTFGLALIYLLAPTSTPERIRLVTRRSQGFVYLVSVAGTTGAREHLPPDLSAFVNRVRAVTDKPLAVGFGISTPEQARQVAELADGVVVGSALVRLAGAPDGSAQVKSLVGGLRHAVASRPRGRT